MTEPGGQQPDERPGSIKPLPGAVAFVGMGTSVAGCVAAGVVLGIFGDDKLHTSPLLLVIGLIVGLAAGVGSVFAQVRRFL